MQRSNNNACTFAWRMYVLLFIENSPIACLLEIFCYQTESSIVVDRLYFKQFLTTIIINYNKLIINILHILNVPHIGIFLFSTE